MFENYGHPNLFFQQNKQMTREEFPFDMSSLLALFQDKIASIEKDIQNWIIPAGSSTTASPTTTSPTTTSPIATSPTTTSPTTTSPTTTSPTTTTLTTTSPTTTSPTTTSSATTTQATSSVIVQEQVHQKQDTEAKPNAIHVADIEITDRLPTKPNAKGRLSLIEKLFGQH